MTLPSLPPVRGKLIANAPLAPYTWFRVGGPADALFLPEDEADLEGFLKALDPAIPVTILGVGSNLIVRDGGIEGVVIRLMGRQWGEITKTGETELTAGSGAPDLAVAKAAAKHGLTGLEFLSGIPGSLGGATRTNAGCYGRELKDVLVRLEGLTRTGERRTYGDGHASSTSPTAIQTCRTISPSPASCCRRPAPATPPPSPRTSKRCNRAAPKPSRFARKPPARLSQIRTHRARPTSAPPGS